MIQSVLSLTPFIQIREKVSPKGLMFSGGMETVLKIGNIGFPIPTLTRNAITKTFHPK